MTATPQARRKPSPSPSVKVRKFTEPFEGAPAERETAPESSLPPQSSLTFRELAARVLKYWIPPRPLADPPPSAAQLWAYAIRGKWTGQTEGPLRRLMAIYIFAVVFPAVVVLRYAEWFIVRPGRLFVLIVLILFAIWS